MGKVGAVLRISAMVAYVGISGSNLLKILNTYQQTNILALI